MTKSDKSLVKKLLQSPEWKVVILAAQEKISVIGSHMLIANTEWDTIKNFLNGEGQIRGIKEFLQYLEQLGEQAND